MHKYKYLDGKWVRVDHVEVVTRYFAQQDGQSRRDISPDEVADLYGLMQSRSVATDYEYSTKEGPSLTEFHLTKIQQIKLGVQEVIQECEGKDTWGLLRELEAISDKISSIRKSMSSDQKDFEDMQSKLFDLTDELIAFQQRVTVVSDAARARRDGDVEPDGAGS